MSSVGLFAWIVVTWGVCSCFLTKNSCFLTKNILLHICARNVPWERVRLPASCGYYWSFMVFYWLWMLFLGPVFSSMEIAKDPKQNSHWKLPLGPWRVPIDDIPWITCYWANMVVVGRSSDTRPCPFSRTSLKNDRWSDDRWDDRRRWFHGGHHVEVS